MNNDFIVVTIFYIHLMNWKSHKLRPNSEFTKDNAFYRIIKLSIFSISTEIDLHTNKSR